MSQPALAPDVSRGLPHWREWLGRSEQRVDFVSAAPLAALAATLDRDEAEPVPGSDVPPLAHWLYFLPAVPAHNLGNDRHPQRGGLLPPVPLPRRLWAGSRLVFHHALQVGDEITRRSQLVHVKAKAGRSGPLVFATLRHEIGNARGLAIEEEQDIVYSEQPAAGMPPPSAQAAPADESFARELMPDPVLLFRYSALSFNAHRIHYDRRHAIDVEGYPGLVVQGPLIATLLLDLLRRERPQARLKAFSFRVQRPTFDTHRFQVCGRDDGRSTFPLWCRDHEGHLTLSAEARTE